MRAGASRDPALAELLRILRSQRLADLSTYVATTCQTCDASEAAQARVDPDFLGEMRRVFGPTNPANPAVALTEELLVRQRVEPVQAALNEWMAGARAQVGGEEIPFGRLIQWCQACRDADARDAMVKEARSLCRFLAPFSHATWQAALACIQEELGYRDYVAYCQARRSSSLAWHVRQCRAFLDRDRSGYEARVGDWLFRYCPGLRLGEATRFDAIHLLGMRYLDHLARPITGQVGQALALSFFQGMGVDASRGLRLHQGGEPGRQSYCVPVSVPHQVHVILGPFTGWNDWEAMFHELGHAYSFIKTNEALPPDRREMMLTGAVSEAFAFLFQRLCMKADFLIHVAGLDPEIATEVSRVQALKIEVLERRYGAKFLVEYENFSQGLVSKGQEHYAAVMGKETGFVYGPETYLFDLMPEFYSLDYLTAYRAARIMEGMLEEGFGPEWYRDAAARRQLDGWAESGPCQDIRDFVEVVIGRPLWPKDAEA